MANQGPPPPVKWVTGMFFIPSGELELILTHVAQKKPVLREGGLFYKVRVNYGGALSQRGEAPRSRRDNWRWLVIQKPVYRKSANSSLRTNPPPLKAAKKFLLLSTYFKKGVYARA